MKVGVLKLGARISFSSTGSSVGEVLSILKILTLSGVDCVVFTKILAKDRNPSHIEFRDIIDDRNTYDLDKLIVVNGHVQFYGGNSDPAQLLNYTIINQFRGPVFYCYCDPELTLKQVWPAVQKKPWGSKWAEADLNITRTDIQYLSQPFDVVQVAKDIKGIEVNPASITHFPFEQFPCLNSQLPFNSNPEVDLSYGGTMRGGKRIKKMMRFYFGHPPEISVEMFGKIDATDFDPCNIGMVPIPYPWFSGQVSYDDMLPKMNKSLAHCVIGDPYYSEVQDLPQRVYESIQSSVVTFIDAELDINRRVYGKDKALADFLYVQNRVELSDRILLLKADANLRRQVVADQIKAIDFSAREYSARFLKALSS